MLKLLICFLFPVHACVLIIHDTWFLFCLFLFLLVLLLSLLFGTISMKSRSLHLLLSRLLSLLILWWLKKWVHKVLLKKISNSSKETTLIWSILLLRLRSARRLRTSLNSKTEWSKIEKHMKLMRLTLRD